MPYYAPQRDRVTVILQAGAAAGHSPVDSTTYTVGLQPGFNPSNGETGFAFIFPRAGKAVNAQGSFLVLGTLGSTENLTVAIRNHADNTLETIVSTLQASAVDNALGNSSLSLAFDRGEQMSVQITTPAWATNPTVTFWNVSVEVEYLP